MNPKTEFRRLLDQWARWQREGLRYLHCGSVEHKYLSPQCWEAPEPRPPEINRAEALEVERAIVGHPRIPDKYRHVLVWTHVHRVKVPHVLSRLVKRRYKVWIRPNDVEELLHDAERMVANRLRRVGIDM